MRENLSTSGRCYVALVVVSGAFVVLTSLWDLYVQPTDPRWLVLAALTLVSGSFTLKIPGISSSISVSETFVIIATVLFGIAPATVVVAFEGLVISLWLLKNTKEVYRVFFNMAAGAVSVWCSGHLFLFASNIPLFSWDPPQSLRLVIPVFVFALSYFLFNSWLIATAVGYELRLPARRVWWPNFTWLSLNYIGGASVAALLLPYIREVGLPAILIIAPLLVLTYLTFRTTMGRIEDTNQHLVQLNRLYLSTIETLAMAIDAKDQITHGHVRRVQLYASALARALGIDTDRELKAIEAAALLHDMGKLAVPEYILNKPGKLLPGEFEKMKRHASIGADILSAIDFPYPVVPIVRHHHENWDGTGYPEGLSREQIPLGARLLAVADCFDALTSDRPYRPRLADEEALRILKERRGNMYDPRVVDTFISIYRTVGVKDPELGSASSLNAIAASAQLIGTVDARGSRLEDITASTQEMLTVYDLARSLTGRLDFPDAADVIAKHVKRLVPAATCVFYVYDRQRDDLIASHASGEHAGVISGLRIPLGERLTGWVAANRTTILNSDPVLDLGDSARSLVPRPRSCLSTALVSDGELVGALTLYSTAQQGFCEDHRRIIDLISRQVSKAIYQALRLGNLKSAGPRDTVTGLPTVHQLREFFALTASQAEHKDQFTSLLLIDVDRLKGINTQYGRQVGDQVLSSMVRAISKSLRGADALFRYTSDEFVVLLSHTDATTCQMIGDRIKSAVEQSGYSGLGVGVTVSLGLASSPDDGESLDELVEVARQRLHQAQKMNSPTSFGESGTRVH